MTHWVIYVTAALAGLILGSFLNVVIHRGPVLWKLVDAPDRGGLAFPRSHCPSCTAPIRIAHLIPLAGYIALRGRCADCGARIALRYPVVEIMGALAGVVAIHAFWITPEAAFAFLFFLFLIALAAIDYETGYLPDALTLPLILLGFGVNITGMFATSTDALLGAAAGYSVFTAAAFMFHLLRGMEGLGQGDAKLLAAIGAWLGWMALPIVVLLAALLALGGVAAKALAGAKIGRETPVPFGPALAAAGAFVMIVYFRDIGGVLTSVDEPVYILLTSP